MFKILRNSTFTALLMLVMAEMAPAAIAAELTVEQEIEVARSMTEGNRQAAVVASMALPPEVAQEFLPVYRDYRSKVAKINDELQALIFRYAENYADMPGDEAYDLARDALNLQVKRDKLKRKYLKRFSRHVSKMDAARVIQIENKLDALGTALLSDQIPLLQP